MLYVFLLACFLLQFLVIVGLLVFVIFFARPEIPLKGDGRLERTALDNGKEPATRGKDASSDSHKPINQLIAVQPPVLVTHSHSLGRSLY